MFKVLAARIVVFAFTCIWILGLLLGGIICTPVFIRALEESNAHPGLVGFLGFWYLATIVVVGAWTAVKSFRFIGRWEKDKDKDKAKESE